MSVPGTREGQCLSQSKSAVWLVERGGDGDVLKARGGQEHAPCRPAVVQNQRLLSLKCPAYVANPALKQHAFWKHRVWFGA